MATTKKQAGAGDALNLVPGISRDEARKLWKLDLRAQGARQVQVWRDARHGGKARARSLALKRREQLLRELDQALDARALADRMARALGQPTQAEREALPATKVAMRRARRAERATEERELEKQARRIARQQGPSRAMSDVIREEARKLKARDREIAKAARQQKLAQEREQDRQARELRAQELAQARALRRQAVEDRKAARQAVKDEALRALVDIARFGRSRRDYNESRPHSALDWATPAEIARGSGLQAAAAISEEPEASTSERY